MLTFSATRAGVALALAVAAFAGLGGRVAYLQTYGREETARKADRQQHREQALPARRGSVFDRNGLLMAGTFQASVLYVDPKFLLQQFDAEAKEELEKIEWRKGRLARGKDIPAPPKPETLEKWKQTFPWRYTPWEGTDRAIDTALAEVAALVKMDPGELQRTVWTRRDDRFVKLDVRIDDEETVKKVMALKVPGVGFTPVSVRSYPMADYASHVLGGIAGDGVGIDGLEARFERELKGRDGFLREMTDSRGNPISVSTGDYEPPRHGKQLVLTIDANIQMIAEQELRASVAEFGAKQGEVVVMDPWTGEVLALANWPTFAPEDYLAAGKEERVNRALVAPYEPGSTIKPFVVGPAMDRRMVRMTDTLDTHGGRYTTPYGRPITDVHGYGKLLVWDVMVKSSNVGMVLVGERMKTEGIHSALRGFGFGQRTGIELPGEAPGVLRSSGWTKFTPDSWVQGYEVMVTPLQLARGMAAIANGGRMVTPTVVKGVVDAEGDVARLAGLKRSIPERDPRAMEPETSAELRRVLADVLVRGTGTRARSDLYNVFGKTGTAHLTEKGRRGYSPDRYTSSFIAGAPYEHPRLVVAFVIHEAEKKGKQYFGGTTAAPGASRVLERSLLYLGEPASPRLAPPEPRIADALYNYQESAYLEWPENVRKQRATEGTPLLAPRASTSTEQRITGNDADVVPAGARE